MNFSALWRIGIFLYFFYLWGEGQILTYSQEAWVDSILNQMSLEEKIGQLFMPPAYTDHRDNFRQILRLIREYHIGGVIFMQGTPYKQGYYTNLFQEESKIPLLIAQDAEWGVSMRLDSVIRFPKNMVIGALTNDSLVYEYGKAIAMQCKLLGVHVNFAPVMDVNSNPANPVINDRAFGSDPHLVARKALMMIEAFRKVGIIPVGKHFPGHGDTDKDSHLELPVVSHSFDRLWNVELYPFRQAILYGLPALMAAHISVPALDSSGIPISLSRRVLTEFLRRKLGFEGVVFTDALNMRAVTKLFPPGEIELQALKAGNDILLYCQNVPLAIQRIKEAVFNGELTEEELDAHVRRILRLKYKAGLANYQPVDLNNLTLKLNSPYFSQLKRKILQNAVTIVRNEVHYLPLRNLPIENLVYLQIGYSKPAPFYFYLRTYKYLPFYVLPSQFSPVQMDSLFYFLDSIKATTIIIGLFEIKRSPIIHHGLSPFLLDLLCRLKLYGLKRILCLFGNPYALQYMGDETAILVGYDENESVQEACAEVIFGGSIPNGILPIQLDHLPQRDDYLPLAVRYGFAILEDFGISSKLMKEEMDSLIEGAVNRYAMPGIAVGVLYQNQILFHQGYGYQTYAKHKPIDPYFSIYDLASLTKVCATTLGIMSLVEQGELEIRRTLGFYLPEIRGSPLEKIKIYELLSHQSGLIPWMPLYKDLINDSIPLNHSPWDTIWLSQTRDSLFSIPVSRNLFLNKFYLDTLRKKIFSLKPSKEWEGEYSDFNFILLGFLIEKITGKSLEHYLKEQFYDKMGMDATMFLPAEKNIVFSTPPTEVDDYFRFDTIVGYVNDENAALLGGIAGHAGLFSNIYDLLKLAFLLLNGGRYGETSFLKEETIRLFTEYPSKNGFGLGWRRAWTNQKEVISSPLVSRKTFGHLGFTGTAFWIDPVNEIAIVILTNRTYPSRQNKEYLHQNIRVQIVDVIYKHLFSSKTL